MKTLWTSFASMLVMACSNNYRDKIVGEWVHVQESSIRLQIRNDGDIMDIRYRYLNFILDTLSTDNLGKVQLDTITAPHNGQWVHAYYNRDRGILIGDDASQVSYSPSYDGITRLGGTGSVTAFRRVR